MRTSRSPSSHGITCIITSSTNMEIRTAKFAGGSIFVGVQFDFSRELMDRVRAEGKNVMAAQPSGE